MRIERVNVHKQYASDLDIWEKSRGSGQESATLSSLIEALNEPIAKAQEFRQGMSEAFGENVDLKQPWIEWDVAFADMGNRIYEYALSLNEGTSPEGVAQPFIYGSTSPGLPYPPSQTPDVAAPWMLINQLSELAQPFADEKSWVPGVDFVMSYYERLADLARRARNVASTTKSIGMWDDIIELADYKLANIEEALVKRQEADIKARAKGELWGTALGLIGGIVLFRVLTQRR